MKLGIWFAILILLSPFTSSRYEQVELEGDCKHHVRTGSYALPIVVTALIDQ